MTALEELRAANVQTLVVLIVLVVLDVAVAVVTSRRELRHQAAVLTLAPLLALLVLFARNYVGNIRGAELFNANQLAEFETLSRVQEAWTPTISLLVFAILTASVVGFYARWRRARRGWDVVAMIFWAGVLWLTIWVLPELAVGWMW